MQRTLANCGHQAVPCIPRTYLFYNRKFAPFDPLPFIGPISAAPTPLPKLSQAPPHLWQPHVCFYNGNLSCKQNTPRHRSGSPAAVEIPVPPPSLGSYRRTREGRGRGCDFYWIRTNIYLITQLKYRWWEGRAEPRRPGWAAFESACRARPCLLDFP